MFLVKLGGSVITQKEKYATFREKRTLALVRELLESMSQLPKERVILVHGAGSFGHILAHDHGIHRGLGKATNHVRVVSQIKRDVRKLNSRVLEKIVENSAQPIPVSPEVILHKNGENKFQANMAAIENLEKMTEEGFLPVLFGDVVFDDEKLFSICSGDDIIEILASQLERINKIIFVTNVDGIYDTVGQGLKGSLIESITPKELSDVMSKHTTGKTENRIKDVTGNMAGKARKIENIVKYCDVWVINGNVDGRLSAAILGKTHIGTHIHTGRKGEKGKGGKGKRGERGGRDEKGGKGNRLAN